jgi:hypothetical protein
MAMDAKQLDAALQKIEDTYFANDENAEAAIASLTELHKKVLADPAALALFNEKAALTCGGLYLPYLFWPVLHNFFADETQRTALGKLFHLFGESNFDEETQKLMKPLVVVYFMKEKEFELDRLKTFVLQKLHPGVQEYFAKLMEFVVKNRNSADAYLRKFTLLGGEFPDFERFAQPVSKLEEELA